MVLQGPSQQLKLLWTASQKTTCLKTEWGGFDLSVSASEVVEERSVSEEFPTRYETLSTSGRSEPSESFQHFMFKYYTRARVI